MNTRVVYWREGVFSNASLPRDDQANDGSVFRSGDAGSVWYTESGQLVTHSKIGLSVNSTHALIGHGVVDALNRLPIHGRLGRGFQVLIPPSVCESACSLLYEADRKTYGARFEFVVSRQAQPDSTEYRIRIDNREYQRTLSGLRSLLSSVSREGRAAWLRI